MSKVFQDSPRYIVRDKSKVLDKVLDSKVFKDSAREIFSEEVCFRLQPEVTKALNGVGLTSAQDIQSF